MTINLTQQAPCTLSSSARACAAQEFGPAAAELGPAVTCNWAARQRISVAVRRCLTSMVGPSWASGLARDRGWPCPMR